MDKYGKWETIKELGEGGQGTVHLAKDTDKTGQTQVRRVELKRAVASLASAQMPEAQQQSAQDLVDTLSLLAPSTSLDPSMLGAIKVMHKPKEDAGYEKAKARLKREVDILNQIDHPNILKILDHNVNQDWFVGEYHPGGTLWEHKDLFKGDLLRALTAFRPLVEGVVEIHKKGGVHRDIKPHNVFIASNGRLVLGDFGIVFFDDASHSRLSETYENMGSRDWMPGWAMGMSIEATEPSFDVFGLGKLLWAMLSGRSVLQLWYHHKRANELEEIFDKDESMRWARVILDRCIVEDEIQCLRSASALLELVNNVLDAVTRHAQVVGDGIVRKCTVCGMGAYWCIVDETNTADVQKLGLNPGPSFKIFRCSHCGHLQLFHMGDPDAKPKAWKKN